MFSFVSLDAKSTLPVALIAVAAVAVWFFWSRAKKNEADAQAEAVTAAPTEGQSTTAALLAKLFGTGTAASPAATGQVSYSAPGSTGSNAQAVPAAPQPLGSGSSTGNTPITQGL